MIHRLLLVAGMALSLTQFSSSGHADPSGAIALAVMTGAAGVVVGSMSGETYSIRDEVQGTANARKRGQKGAFDVAYPVYQPTAFVPANTPVAAVYSSVPPHRPHTEDLYSSQMMVYVPYNGR